MDDPSLGSERQLARVYRFGEVGDSGTNLIGEYVLQFLWDFLRARMF